MPTLNMRLSAPKVLIDVNAIARLDGIEETPRGIRIGALARHRDVAASDLVRQRLPLIADAVRHIGHAAIRNRGTFGGSLALADPAAELPACALVLGAQLTLAGPEGERVVHAEDFFHGMFETALAPGEILVSATFPAPAEGAVWGFAELARRHGDYAMAGLAVSGTAPGGTLEALRMVFFGVADRPVLAPGAAEAVLGQPLDALALDDAAAALDGDLDPMGDLHAPAAVKRHLAKVLTRRVLADLGSVS
jgi:carbon-monoxide dehydrogenase medium subunit